MGKADTDSETKMRQRGRLAQEIALKHGFASYHCISYVDTRESASKESSLVESLVERISLIN